MSRWMPTASSATNRPAQPRATPVRTQQPANTPYCFACLSTAAATQESSSPTQTTNKPHGFSLSAEADRLRYSPSAMRNPSCSPDCRPLGSQE